jgi:hypothetical protein
MKRLLLMLTLAAVLTATVWAQGTPVAPSLAEQADQFKRNRDLVEALVDGGLRLAKQEDRVERARSCNSLAERLADEIRRAARRGEEYRAGELGRHLYSLLHEGVASNLKKASANTARESPGMQELARIRDDTKKIIGLLDADLPSGSEQTLQVIRAGRDAVDAAVPSGSLQSTSQPAQPK